MFCDVVSDGDVIARETDSASDCIPYPCHLSNMTCPGLTKMLVGDVLPRQGA